MWHDQGIQRLSNNYLNENNSDYGTGLEAGIIALIGLGALWWTGDAWIRPLIAQSKFSIAFCVVLVYLYRLGHCHWG